MFQFLNPIWFFGAAALLIPVLIHLWNIRSGKVLKVGSISLINAASRKSSRSFKLLDIPLFILRCLLLFILALLLALPVWQKKIEAAKVKGWVLFPKENLLYLRVAISGWIGNALESAPKRVVIVMHMHDDIHKIAWFLALPRLLHNIKDPVTLHSEVATREVLLHLFGEEYAVSVGQGSGLKHSMVSLCSHKIGAGDDNHRAFLDLRECA